MKIQKTKQHSTSKLKNTYRIKEIPVTINVTSKEDCQKNKLSNQCSKFPSKALISISVFNANFEECLITSFV